MNLWAFILIYFGFMVFNFNLLKSIFVFCFLSYSVSDFNIVLLSLYTYSSMWIPKLVYNRRISPFPIVYQVE